MARGARRLAASGYYHVVMRGSGKQLIFEDDADRVKFLGYLDEMLRRHEAVVIGWCLMSNHVHLLVSDPTSSLSSAIHDIAAAYAGYFNRKTGHVGAVFDGRFKSVPIESDAQLVSAVRYIHNNPVRGGICAACDYRWSSYHEYAGNPSLTDVSVLADMLGGLQGLLSNDEGDACVPYCFVTGKRIPDDEALDVAGAILYPLLPDDVKGLPVEQRAESVGRLSEGGLSCRQIQRLTGLGRYSIDRALGRR